MISKITKEIIAILLSINNFENQYKSLTSREIKDILKDYSEVEIETELQSLKKRSLFIKSETKNKEIAYWFQLFSPTKAFLEKLADETKNILAKNPTENVNDLEKILKLHAFTFDQLKVLYPDYKKLKDQTLRSFFSSLHILTILESNGLEAYYLNLPYLQTYSEIHAEMELDSFWNPVINYESLNKIDVHGLFWKSDKKEKINVNKIKADPTWKLVSGKGENWIKEIPIPLGTLKFQVYSNIADPDYHTLHIHYEGSLLLINALKQKIRGKFSVNLNEIGSLITIIESELYKCEIAKEFEFSHKEFEGFTLESIGFNIDTDLEQIKNQSINFQKTITTRDFNHYYTLRFYKWEDKFTDKEMGRLDAHFDNPNSQNILGFLEGITGLSRNKINPAIERRELTKVIYETKAQIEGIDKDLTNLNQSVIKASNETNKNIFIFQNQQNINATHVVDSVSHLEHKFSQDLSTLNIKIDTSDKSQNKKLDSLDKMFQTQNALVLNNLNDLKRSTSALQIENTGTQTLVNGIKSELRTGFNSLTQTIESNENQMEDKIDDSLTTISQLLQSQESSNTQIFDALKDNVIELTDNLSIVGENNTQNQKKNQEILTKISENIFELTQIAKAQTDMTKAISTDLLQVKATYLQFQDIQSNKNTLFEQSLLNINQNILNVSNSLSNSLNQQNQINNNIVQNINENKKSLYQKWNENRKKKKQLLT